MKRILSFLALFFLILFFACEDSTGPTESMFNVKYSVTGAAKTVSITYENESGGTSQIATATVPWEHNFTVKKDTWVYISAQNNGQTGTVTVSIYKNGTLFKSSTSSGAYVIATASGIIK